MCPRGTDEEVEELCRGQVTKECLGHYRKIEGDADRSQLLWKTFHSICLAPARGRQYLHSTDVISEQRGTLIC
jgi:hypothetical protein